MRYFRKIQNHIRKDVAQCLLLFSYFLDSLYSANPSRNMLTKSPILL